MNQKRTQAPGPLDHPARSQNDRSPRRAIRLTAGCGWALILGLAAGGCHGPAGTRTAATPETAQRLYAQHCLGCHGPTGAGATYGPNIQGLHRTIDQIVAVIASGRGRMPAFTGDLSEEEMRQVAAYVKTFKDKQP
jgi:cytochrome c6